MDKYYRVIYCYHNATPLFIDSFPECQEAAVPFLCRYYFPLSDCSSGYIYSASREDCIAITTTVCSTPWTLAITLGYGDQLPNCQELPPADNITNPDTVDNSQSLLGNLSSNNITCLDDFTLTNSVCIPRCDRFQQNSPIESILLVVFETVAAFIAGLLSVIIMIFTLKKGKQM